MKIMTYAGFSAIEQSLYSPEQQLMLSTVMDQSITSIRGAISKLRNKITHASSAWLFLLGPISAPFLSVQRYSTPDETRRAVSSGLATIENIINTRIALTSRTAVLNGTLSPKKWMASMEELVKGVEAQAEYLQEGSLVNLVSSQWRETKAQMDRVWANIERVLIATGKLAEASLMNLPLLVGTAVAAMVLLHPLSPLTIIGRR